MFRYNGFLHFCEVNRPHTISRTLEKNVMLNSKIKLEKLFCYTNMVIAFKLLKRGDVFFARDGFMKNI